MSRDPADRRQRWDGQQPDTLPLPKASAAVPDAQQLPVALRMLEALSALLAAGVLAIGLVLAASAVFAPHLVPGSGLSAAAGPRPDRVLVPVVVGLASELLHWRRARLPRAVRVATAVLTMLAVLAALWWGWWR